MTVEPCRRCHSPLTTEQRWCVVCGARRAGADVRTLLFGAPQSPAAADAAGTGGPAHALAAADAPGGGGPDHGLAGANAASAGAGAGSGEQPGRSAAIARRRRAAVPVALASLVGLVAVSVTTVPASLAGSSSQDPFTVVLPAQEAQQVAQAPAVADPAATPVEEAVAPVVETPSVVTPAASPTPVTPAPAASDETASGDAKDGGTDGGTDGDKPGGDKRAPVKEEAGSPIEHVFLIALGGADVNALAGDAAAAPYLSGTLARGGTLLSDYRTVARGGLADAIALVSGQDPVSQTPAGCAPAGALAGGDGCVYGAKTKHVGDQLRAAKRTWKAYVEPSAGASAAGGNPLAGAASACAAGSLRNPFLSFRGTVEADDCDARNVALERLGADLKTAKTTPALAWIASDAQQGSADADAFLQRVVPQIQESPAYAEGGLIVIVGDQLPAAGDAAGADLPVGALLLSPFTPAGRVDATAADAFTLLRTLQEIYGVDPLGHAADDGFEPLPAKLFAVRP